MEINNTPPELKNTSTNNLSSDNGSRNDPSTSTSYQWNWGWDSIFGGKFDRTRDVTPEGELNVANSMKRKRAESFRKDEGKVRVEDLNAFFQCVPTYQHKYKQMQPTTSYPTNGYAVDPSQSNFMMPQYNIYNTINQYSTPVNSVVSCMDKDSPITSMNPYLYVDPPDRSLYEMMPPVQNYFPMPMMKEPLLSISQKTVKVFTNCTLYPPLPSDPPPSRRERRGNCMTVFVKGLPAKITEDILKEVFSECGEIDTIRMTNKNFCLIKFTSELHADQAFFFSDYRIIIENKDEPSYNGRLHVDYALSRLDKYKCECIMRKFSRAARHANMEDPFRPLLVKSERASPEDRLQVEDELLQTSQMLITSIEQRNRHKRRAKAEFIRLTEEKAKLQEENERLRNQLKAATDEVIVVKHEDDKKNAALLEAYHLMQQNYIETKKKLEDTVKEKLALESTGIVPSEGTCQH